VAVCLHHHPLCAPECHKKTQTKKVFVLFFYRRVLSQRQWQVLPTATLSSPVPLHTHHTARLNYDRDYSDLLEMRTVRGREPCSYRECHAHQSLLVLPISNKNTYYSMFSTKTTHIHAAFTVAVAPGVEA
jgi:hypothetical protein